MKQYERASQLGLPRAMFEYAVPLDAKHRCNEAVMWLQRAADKHDPRLRMDLASAFSSDKPATVGEGYDRREHKFTCQVTDYVKAVGVLNEAVEQRDYQARLALGDMYR